MSGNGDGRAGPRAGGVPLPDAAERGISGRRFILAAAAGVLLLWGVLFLTFSAWRSGYRARAAFGVARVADAVAPLAKIRPDPGGAPSPEAWRKGVADTREMLVTLTATNLLDEAQMAAMGDRIARDVAAATPATAPDVLAAIWDEAEAGAGPLIAKRHPRPPWLRPAPARD